MYTHITTNITCANAHTYSPVRKYYDVPAKEYAISTAMHSTVSSTNHEYDKTVKNNSIEFAMDDPLPASTYPQ